MHSKLGHTLCTHRAILFLIICTLIGTLLGCQTQHPNLQNNELLPPPHSSTPALNSPVLVYQDSYTSISGQNTQEVESSNQLLSEQVLHASSRYSNGGFEYQLMIDTVQEIIFYSAAQPVSATVQDSKAEIIVFDTLIPVTFCSNLEKDGPIARLFEEWSPQIYSATVQEAIPFQLLLPGGQPVRVMFAPLYRCYSGSMTVTNALGELQYTLPVFAMFPVEGTCGIEGVYYHTNLQH